MLCNKCRIPMYLGTRYEQIKGRDQTSNKRYFECVNCHGRFYVNELNIQKLLVKKAEKTRKK